MAKKTTTTDAVVSATQVESAVALLRDGIAKASAATHCAQIVSGTVTVAQCKATQPKSLGKIGISGNPFHTIDPARSPLDVTQDEYTDSLVDGVLAGDATVTVVTAAADTKTQVTRMCSNDSDLESVANAELVRSTLNGSPLTVERVEIGILTKNAVARMSRK